MPDYQTDALSRVGALVEGPAFYPHLSGRANLARLDAADRTASPATAAEPDRRRRWTGSGCWPQRTRSTAPTRSA